MKSVTSPYPSARLSRKRRPFRWLPFLMIMSTAILVGAVAAAACTFVLKWGTAGSDNGQFLTARGIAVDTAGNVYVVDASGDTRGQIQKFDANGTFLARVGANNDNPDGFVSAYRIASDSSNNIYATDGNADRSTNLVKKFNSSGVFQFAFGTRGSGGGQFAVPGPAGIAINSSGNIYVADPGNNRVQKDRKSTRLNS